LERDSLGVLRGRFALRLVGAIAAFGGAGSISPWLAVLIAALVLGVPLLASEELLERIHRIFWRREWPK
jgi:hypothetical protein